MTGVAQELADLVGGDLRAGSLIIIRDGDTVHVIDCRHTGHVYLDDRYQLGTISDGPELLAAKYHAAFTETPC